MRLSQRITMARFVLTLVAGLIVCSSTVRGGEPTTASRVVLYEVTQPTWCPACRLMAPIIARLQARGFPILDGGGRYTVTCLPTYLMTVDGLVVSQCCGVREQADLATWIADTTIWAEKNHPRAKP